MRTFILTYFILNIINMAIHLGVMSMASYPRTEVRSLGRDVASAIERLFWLGWMSALLWFV